jgi:hypothetical protein
MTCRERALIASPTNLIAHGVKQPSSRSRAAAWNWPSIPCDVAILVVAYFACADTGVDWNETCFQLPFCLTYTKVAR